MADHTSQDGATLHIVSAGVVHTNITAALKGHSEAHQMAAAYQSQQKVRTQLTAWLEGSLEGVNSILGPSWKTALQEGLYRARMLVQS